MPYSEFVSDSYNSCFDLMMPLLYHKMTLNMIVFMLCITTAVMIGQQELPVMISPISKASTPGQCPSDDNRREVRNILQNATREIIYDRFADPISQICGPGEWRRVFHLNASRSDQSCPGQWNLYTSPVRGCGGVHSSCRSAFSNNTSNAYSKVCGRIIGEGVTSPDAFYRFISGQDTIEGNYLDGVSVTHGASGSRKHIWSFGAGHRGRCPCDSSNRGGAPLPPAEVGDNYFCDRADELDRLWTRENCMNGNPCCSFNNPPYFSVQLPAATTDRIELRICIDQSQGDETVLVLFGELYVQ